LVIGALFLTGVAAVALMRRRGRTSGRR
jgi:hypothetical protein